MTAVVKILTVSKDAELLASLKDALSGRGSPGAMRIRQDFVQRLRTARGLAHASEESMAPRWSVSVCNGLDSASDLLESWASEADRTFLVILDCDVDDQEAIALFILTVQAVSEHAHTLVVARGGGATLRAAVEDMGDGARCTFLRKPSNPEELARSIMFTTWRSLMTSSLQEADQRGFSGVSAADLAGALIVESEAEQRRFAVQDPLTKLGNRRLFDASLVDVCRLQRHQRTHALMLLDLDRFKQVNDTLGHGVGDTLLQQVAERLREAVEPSDIVFRLGGDEFAILKAESSAVEALAKRLIERLQKPFSIGAHTVTIGASIGWACFEGETPKPEEITGRADLALYSAKNAGRGQAVQYSPEQDRRRQSREALEQRVRVGMAQGAAPVLFSPIAETQAGLLVAAEVGLRLAAFGSTEGYDGSLEDIVSDPQLRLEMGFWTFAAALEAGARFGRLEMAINLTPTMLRSEFLADRLSLMAIRAGVAPQRLVLEAPAAFVFLNYDKCVPTLSALNKAGFPIVLDHFGAGALAIDSLLRLPIGSVKLDGSVTKDVLHASGAAQIAMGVMAIAAGAGLRVTAEGADTEQHWGQLIGMGCTRLQGLAVGGAMSLANLEKAVDPRATPDIAGGQSQRLVG